MTALALLFLLACAFWLGYAVRPRPMGRERQGIPEMVVCAACDGPRQVQPDGSCYACGSRSVLRVKERPRGGSYQHASVEAPERDYLAGLIGKQ